MPFVLQGARTLLGGDAMREVFSDRDLFDLDKLQPLFGPEDDRSSLVRLLRNAESMGYTTEIAALEWEDLRHERRPIIARVVKENAWDDYVLLQGIVGDEVVMVDGELHIMRLSREDFVRLWTGWVVMLQKRIRSAGA
jgi:ABC-type bacteriocin/lantibiotic exporter with double-glycine peptidase domain